MSMMKKIEIDGRRLLLRHRPPFRVFTGLSSRGISTRIYLFWKRVSGWDPEKSSLDLFSLEMFENIAYVMAKHADPSIPDNPEDWLDEFNTFSIYQVLPKLIELWGMNIRTDVEAKKLHATDREMTTPLFLLRCVQLGISIRDLDLLTIGMVNDMFVESRNDEYKGWRQVATQEDFDRF